MQLSKMVAAWRVAEVKSVHPLARQIGVSGTDSDAVERVGEVFAAVPGDLGELDVLDYASGPGRLAVVLATRFRHVTLADINGPFLELARARFDRVGLSNFDTVLIEDPVPSVDVFGRRFDVVVSDLFLSHLPLESVPGFMELFRDVLKPGGLLLIGQPVYESDRTPNSWHDISTWTPETLERFATDAGFEVVESYFNDGVFTGVRAANHFRLHTLRRTTDG